jgi:type II secretory pathway pseudopilin PulG
VVVGIIAVIGGAMVASWSGTESRAARRVAAQTLSGFENSIRVFMQLTQRFPNNLESLVCTNYSATCAVSSNS